MSGEDVALPFVRAYIQPELRGASTGRGIPTS